jgi:hypothetical protein
MKIDTEHLHHWMRAIRNSKDPMRTMDAFWRGQLLSKEWLIGNLRHFVPSKMTIDIHGGWVGVLASMIFQSGIPCESIRSVDLDPECENTANTMNQLELEAGRFRAITANMVNLRSDADIVINTSCEHITQDEYDLWLSGMPHNSLIVLQSNNYVIPEHVRSAKSLEEFKEQSQLNTILFEGEIPLPLYNRYMLIGRK